jgi:hypothetical protein
MSVMSGSGIGYWMSVLLILVTVAASGCVIPDLPGFGTPASGHGVSITDWKPDFSLVYSNEKVTFYSNVQNMGSFKASNVNFQVGGLESWEGVKSDNPGCDSGNVELNAPDVQYGTEGEEKLCTWTATSPHIEAGLHMIYNPTITVCYQYFSKSVLRTPSISRYELKRLQDSGSGLPSQSTIAGSSPVTISASTESPIIVTDTEVTFPVKITVSNGGGGLVCMAGGFTDCTDSETINRVKLEVSSATATAVDCPTELGLFRNSGEITCRMKMRSRTQTVVQNEIELTASYTYCMDSTTSIEVRSRQ